ncbi:YqhG family protein [Heyndrickxia acidiproducens]|uniref:YqhG family protein n=1 Tax=Heyndrickxia acidiproducens TaxID=1121084 RepID=UPI00036C1237|nr:YqhG family protein [Heyndrickxia acidiproducens]
MDLQKFVTDVLEGIGGIVDPVEYALCHVLIPEEYSHYFQNRTEFDLSFDYEVAQENPQSEFITFGSYTLEQLLTIVNREAVSTNRFAEVERLSLANPLKKLQEAYPEYKKITILEEARVLGCWAVFQFRVTFVTDEKDEKTDQIWVNLLTGEVSDTMKQEQNRIFYHDQPVYPYPIPGEINIDEAFKTAFQYIRNETERENKRRTQEAPMQKDLDRIESYYRELLAENNKKAKRKGLSLEKKNEISDRSRAIELEKDKQLQEMIQKYNGKVEITLDHGLLYFIPLLQYNIKIQHHLEDEERTVYYNPILKNME